VANPLGSAKGKHKLFAVYYTLGNLHASVRSKIDGLQLILLCKHKFVASIDGLNEVLRPMIDDLVSLQDNGVDLGSHSVRKGKVVFVLGDNLGSHMIGGFVQNFTGTYFCRYCLATNDYLKSCNCLPRQFEKRTPERYNAAVQSLQLHAADSFEGIKHQSVLHQVPGFHVCTPALPPCVGHDLFEGVVPNDLTLCLQYFVNKKDGFHFIISIGK
jgi:hypothetical protein